MDHTVPFFAQLPFAIAIPLTRPLRTAVVRLVFDPFYLAGKPENSLRRMYAELICDSIQTPARVRARAHALFPEQVLSLRVPPEEITP